MIARARTHTHGHTHARALVFWPVCFCVFWPKREKEATQSGWKLECRPHLLQKEAPVEEERKKKREEAESFQQLVKVEIKERRAG